MNKLEKLTFSLLALFTLAQLAACTKVYDKFFGDNKPSKKCRIESFTQNNIPVGPGSRTAQFYYNRHGDIDSIIADVETGSLGAHLFYFSYDRNHRLISYREKTGPSWPYEETHKYAYESGRIVRDSVRVSPDGIGTEVKTLEYDNWGRIIKENLKWLYDNGTVFDDIEPRIFTYNSDGNLVFGSVTYDNQRNFLSTSDQLMFTQRDYSKNNRAGATSYNDSELPLGFTEGIGAVYGPSSLLSFGLPAEINYDCK